ncbi:MAG: TetR/AcrR family transcriptional regulator [Janthinobacterium lividum]
MPRLSREESRARTRELLLAAAMQAFGRDGYAVTSVEKIADAAGFSKGALYSNFDSKEAIFLAVLDRQGQESVDHLLTAINDACDAAAIVELLAVWADERSQSGIWSLTILEHARTAGADAPSLARQREILRGHWRQLGERVAARLPGMTADGETIGALLHEIAYAPALTFMKRPTAGDLMRLALAPWLCKPASA